MSRWTFSVDELIRLLSGTPVNAPDAAAIVADVVSSGVHRSTSSVFVAVRGNVADGHDYIEQAFANGSSLAVVADVDRLGGRPGIVVADTRRALSALCAAFYGNPSEKLVTIGVTGTNGKTTVHWLLYHALDRLGRPGLRIGSLGISAHGKVERSGKAVLRGSGDIQMTTPGPCEIHGALREAVDAGLTSCVLETSSHAIHQHRTTDVAYDAAIFTNLSQDHLNYHGDMEAYFQSKADLFRQLARTSDVGGAVVNAECPFGRRLIVMCRELGLRIWSFGDVEDADVRILDFDQKLPVSTLRLGTDVGRFELTTPLVGAYNGSNMAAAFGGLLALGFNAKEISTALCDVPPIPGRLEAIGTDDVAVFVDYAHTGDGLRNVLSGLRAFAEGDLWVVFGCGGGKDPGKRKAMGDAAAELADRIVLTNDNPRNEDPEKIVREILASGCKPELVELDRAKAVGEVFARAQKGDVVLLAGKGREDYQIVGAETIAYSDIEAARKAKEAGLLDR